MRTGFGIAAFVMLFAACSTPPASTGPRGYHLLLAVAPTGQVTAGSKASLEAAIRSGSDVRVGFGVDFDNDGKTDIEHWADARFLSLYRGEIFAQIAPIQEQGPSPTAPEIHFATAAHPWTGMLDTTGRLRSWFPNEPPTEVRVTTWWYASAE